MVEGWYKGGNKESLRLGRAKHGITVGKRLLTGVGMHQRIEKGTVVGAQ